jgi:hypothetical protein
LALTASNLDHVSHQFIGRFVASATTTRQPCAAGRGLQILNREPGYPIPMLHNNNLCRRV